MHVVNLMIKSIFIHRYLEAGLPFWKSLGYIVTVEEDDYDETIHMIKHLS